MQTELPLPNRLGPENARVVAQGRKVAPCLLVTTSGHNRDHYDTRNRAKHVKV
jgi:hypothetical protein